MPETAIKRVNIAVANGVLSALYGSPIGQMRMRHDLTEKQYAACLWYQELRLAYDRALEIKGVKTGSGEQQSKATPPDPDSRAGKKRVVVDRRAVNQFEAARLAVRTAGSIATFERIVLLDETPDWTARKVVQSISTALADHRTSSARYRGSSARYRDARR